MKVSVRRMTKAAIHPNGSNFRRCARLDIVARTRRLCDVGLIKERPAWLEWCERVPPMELQSLTLQARTVRNPYPRMLQFLLNKYPDLRFQDAYVDGNDWSAGNDIYRDDHPAMQFVVRQLDLMRSQGLSKQEAFGETEELFRGRREHLEREQKVMMAQAYELGISPMFTTGRAYLEAEKAKNEAAHLNKIRASLRALRRQAEAKAAEPSPSAGSSQEPAADEGSSLEAAAKVEEVLGPIRGDRDRMSLLRHQVEAEQALDAEAEEEQKDIGGPEDNADDLPSTRSGAGYDDSADLIDELLAPSAKLSSDDQRSSVSPPVSTPPPSSAQDIDDLFPATVTIGKRSPVTASSARQTTKSTASLGSMLGQSGGVSGEDREQDEDERVAALRKKRLGMDDDDED